MSVPIFLKGIDQLPTGLIRNAENVTFRDARCAPRNPIRHIAIADEPHNTALKLHSIDRSSGEQYAVLANQRIVRVFDLDGAEHLVSGEMGYLSQRHTSNLLDSTGAPANTDDFQERLHDWTWATFDVEFLDELSPVGEGRPCRLTATDTAADTGEGPAFGTDNWTGTAWLCSVYVRQVSATCNFYLRFDIEGTTTTVGTAEFEWDAGEPALVTTDWNAGIFGTFSTQVRDAGDGWFRVLVSMTPLPGETGYVTNATFGMSTGTDARELDVFGVAYAQDADYNLNNAPEYLTDSADEALQFSTFGDVTYVTNRAVPLLTSGLTPTQTYPVDVTGRAFFFVKLGGFTERYTLTYTVLDPDGISIEEDTVTVTTPNADGSPQADPGDADTTSPATTIIAETMAAELTALGSALITAAVEGSLVVITTEDDNTITVEWHDSQADELSVAFSDSVRTVSDLPKTLPTTGTIVKIAGDPENPVDDFWVVWDGEEYVECAEPGIVLGWNAFTMPHTIRRTFNLSGAIEFVFAPAEWDDRVVGDDLLNPFPPLERCTDVGFFDTRLFLIGARHAVLSEVNSPENLFRTTVRSLLASDRVSKAVEDANVDDLHRAVPYRNGLLIASRSALYHLAGSEGIMSPTTAHVETLASFPMVGELAEIGTSVAVGLRGTYGGLAVMALTSEGPQVQDATQSVPRLILSDVRTIESSSMDDVLVVNADRLYVVERGAWSVIPLAANGAVFLADRLLVHTEDWLGILDFRTNDDLRLDRLVELTGTFDGTLTVYDVPYDPADAVAYSGTQELTIVERTATTVTIEGDAGAISLGEPFVALLELAAPLSVGEAGPFHRGVQRVRRFDGYGTAAAMDLSVSSPGRAATTATFRVPLQTTLTVPALTTWINLSPRGLVLELSSSDPLGFSLETLELDVDTVAR